MDALRQWALCLIIGAAAGTFVMAISPRGSMDKTVRAVVGIFVVAAICAPIATLLKEDIGTEAFADYEFEEHGEDELNGYMLEMFRSETEKIILSTADEFDIAVKDICINAEIDAENCIIIHSITVAVRMEDEPEKSSFSDTFFQKTGVRVTVNAE